MNGHDSLVFFVALALLLGVSRLVTEVARGLGPPLILGGTLAGIGLGKTVLARLAPRAYEWLFANTVANTMLDGYGTIGLSLLLLIAGLEVDLSVVWRRGRRAIPLILLGIGLPLGLGIALAFALPARDLANADSRMPFAVFLGAALSISALPVIARTLVSLGLFKTDLGLLVMAAAMVGDLVGWPAFAILLGPLRDAHIDPAHVGVMTLMALGFAALCLSIGRPAFDWLVRRIELQPDTAPGRVLWLVIVFALFGAAITHALGIHAVLGSFFVGVIIGDARGFRLKTREVVREFVTSVFAPVFFALVALRVDFLHAFDLRLVLLIFGAATLAKVLGCTLGARGSGLKWREALAVGFALNARGTMEIVVVFLALGSGLLLEPMFVALVTMTIATSLVSGPVMKRLLYGSQEEDVVGLVRSGAFVTRLEATLPVVAIEELVAQLGDQLGALAEKARVSVIERELVAPTGLEDGIAIPHAAVPGLGRPLLALGRAPHGIDFDAADGKPAKIIFLLLVPAKAYEEEVHILASIARAVFDARARSELMAAEGLDDVMRVLGANAKRTSTTPKRSTSPRLQPAELPPEK